MPDELVSASPLIAVGLGTLVVVQLIKRKQAQASRREPILFGRDERRALAGDAWSHDREDELAIARVHKRLSDFTRAFEIGHCVYIPDEFKAIALAKRVHGPGVDTEVREPLGRRAASRDSALTARTPLPA